MFYEKWKDEALVVDKWFRVQATSELPGAIDRVQALMKHPAFDIRNPNRARSLISAFARANPVHFHAADGSGYRFVAEQVDRARPHQSAGRLGPRAVLRSLEEVRRAAARPRRARRSNRSAPATGYRATSAKWWGAPSPSGAG